MFSCAGMQLGAPDDTPELTNKKAYTVARKEFALTLKKYNDYYDKADAETQAKWKEEVDPLFKTADKALDGWQLAIDNNWDAAGNESKYLEMKSELLIMLVGVFGITEE